MENTKKYLKDLRKKSLKKLNEYKDWAEDEEKHIELIDKCLEELK